MSDALSTSERLRRGVTLVSLVAALFSGCAANMPLRAGGSLDLDQGAVAFFTLRVANAFKPDYQPTLTRGYVDETGPGHRSVHWIAIAAPYSSLNLSDEYLISAQLPPGDYRFGAILARCTRLFGLLLNASYTLPLNLDVSLAPRQIVYLGHVEANIVERASDDSPRAGLVVPLLDQALGGASTGMWMIGTEDRFDDDVALVKQKFGVPAAAEILNRVVPKPAEPAGLP